LLAGLTTTLSSRPRKKFSFEGIQSRFHRKEIIPSAEKNGMDGWENTAAAARRATMLVILLWAFGCDSRHVVVDTSFFTGKTIRER